MTKVITYGTYDFLHYGHIRLLERAKELGDYLIVGVTAEDFDKARGKINVQQSLMERIEAVKATGLADEIIVEEYEGQKIDDIRRYDIDIFTVGSDWVGKFDYLNEFCKVIYLERTQGVSSSEIRTEKRALRLGLVGENGIIEKYLRESSYINGIKVTAICTNNVDFIQKYKSTDICILSEYLELFSMVDAIYIASLSTEHFEQIELALRQGKHVLCEAPITLEQSKCHYLMELAKKKHLILMEAIKTAYSTAYHRLLLMVKGGKIGKVVSVDATCTSLNELKNIDSKIIEKMQTSLCAWGPTALLPVFQLLGTNYVNKCVTTCFLDEKREFDIFTKIDFYYSDAVASIKVGKGVKSEGELVVSGTKGYIYVPAPWWKTDYFEIRYENQNENQRCFYQLDGEGIRNELVVFLKCIKLGKPIFSVDSKISEEVADIMEDFYYRNNFKEFIV